MGTCFDMFDQNLTVLKFYIQNTIERGEAMTSSTHSFAYSYRLFKKCFVKLHSYFHIFPILSDFNQNARCSIRKSSLFLLNHLKGIVDPICSLKM